MTVREVFELAVTHQQAGRLDEADKIYRQLLARFPTNPELLNNLAALLLQKDRFAEAISFARQALKQKPQFAEALFVVGVALTRLKEAPAAIASLRQAVAIRPDFVEALSALAAALQLYGQLDEAVAMIRRAIALKPTFSEAHNNLGNLLREMNHDAEAAAAYQLALAFKPDDPEVLNNLGTLLESSGRYAESIVHFQQAINERPAFAQAHYNLANAYQKSGDVDSAIASYQRAVTLQPNLVEAWINLGNAQCESGRIDAAVTSYQRARDVGLDSRLASTPLYAMHYDARNTPAALLAAHRQWNQKYAAGVARSPKHRNDRSPNRRLRIGYVSADLGNHPVGRFMKPLLANQDADAVEVFVYSGAWKDDELTDRLKAMVHRWHRVRHLTDERLAELIMHDQIDILVDLTMHATSSRLLTFARKPAPVQMTYLAYPGTTGLPQMDYRLTDPYIDPPGQSDEYFSERSLRLPHTYWCYAKPPEAPDIAPMPMLSSGQVAFGSPNASAKVSAFIFDAWIEVLARVKNSRLIMHSREGSHRDELRKRLAARGVDPYRIEFVGFLPPDQYFANYQRFDIVLDTHPYAGGTTTCDALWMGVPVVTLAGATAISRGGCSILANIGLPDLVAHYANDYIDKACELAADPSRLHELRTSLRERMLQSPLMDARQFGRDVEAAFRTAWHAWIASVA